jgi:uncharacterized delta-60 repeat protein
MKALLLTGAMACALFLLTISPVHAQPGSLDISFNPGSGPNPSSISCMALETNGQIVLGGSFTSFNGFQSSYVARLDSDGSVDTSFYTGVGPNAQLTSVLAQSNGEVLIAGYFSSINGLRWNQPALLRTDGSLDPSFDTSEADGGGIVGDGITAMALQADGKILLGGGSFLVSNMTFNGIVRLDTNAALDLTFQPESGASNGDVLAIGFQSAGQIIVGGSFTGFNGVPNSYLARLNFDGSVDTSFNNGGLQDGYIQNFAITPQDQIVICGSFTSINGYSRNGIARLNSNGTLDTTFNPGFGFNGSISAICAQSNGMVVIAGSFTQFNGSSCAGLARLNTNATLDTSFGVGTGPYRSGTITRMAGQPNGDTLIAGDFTSFNGTNVNGIARLNGDGPIPTAPILLNPQLYFGMNLSGTVSNRYLIEWTTDIAAPSLWTPLFDVTLQTDPQFIVDPTAPTGNRFYRAVQIAP